MATVRSAGAGIFRAAVFLLAVAIAPVALAQSTSDVFFSPAMDATVCNNGNNASFDSQTLSPDAVGHFDEVWSLTTPVVSVSGNFSETSVTGSLHCLTTGNATGSIQATRIAGANSYTGTYSFNGQNGSLTITPRGPTLFVADVSITEGNAGTRLATFTVKLSKAAVDPVVYRIETSNGSATAGSDYVARLLEGETIPAGQLSRTFAVTINGDTVLETDETFTVSLGNATTGASVTDGTAIGTILDDDRPTLTISDATVAEGHAGTKVATFFLTLSQVSATTVTYDIATSNGTASSASDYVAKALTGQTIPAGALSRTFAVTINGDTSIEANETFKVDLANVANALVGDSQGIGAIQNDDSPAITISDVALAEGNAGTKLATFAIRLDRVSPFPVGYGVATSNGTATAGSDFVAASLSGQTIPAGALLRTFAVTVNGDTAVEADETFKATLANVTGAFVADAQGTATIGNDDSPVVTIADVALSEGNAGTKVATFVVRLDRISNAPVGYDIATANHTALAGSDYVQQALTAQSIPAGALARVFSVTVNGDTTVEFNEAFKVNLANVTGATVGDGQALGTLVNDDTATLTIEDASVVEGDAGTKLATFNLRLDKVSTSPVTYDILTADDTALAGFDYEGRQLTAQTIPAGALLRTFTVTINGDTDVEEHEVYYVNLTNVTGAIVGDGQGTGTLTDDDGELPAPIGTIQGGGPVSPLAGRKVRTDGIATALTAQGLFVQSPDGAQDNDASTSEGLFVATRDPSIKVGDAVRVVGKVDEARSGGIGGQTLTRVVADTVVVKAHGRTLPRPVVLDAGNAGPGQAARLERFEGMRVSVPTLVVVAPVGGAFDETTGRARIDGRFFGVVDGVARPFREPGLDATDPLRWIAGVRVADGNPERLQVDSAGQRGALALAADAGDRVSGLQGVLGVGETAYRILPDPTAVVAIVPGAAPKPVTMPTAGQATIGTFDLHRFLDDRRSADEPVADADAYALRLAKAAHVLCAYARNPDIVAITGIEDAAALADLAAAANAKAGNVLFPSGCRREVEYRAFAWPGNDGQHRNLGFLVNVATVRAGVPRVEVLAVQQSGRMDGFVRPDGTRTSLHAKPPLLLRARLHYAGGRSLAVTVVASHFTALEGDLSAPGKHGWATVGDQLRAIRTAQALALAGLVQARQRTHPEEKLVVLGDFDASEFGDGHADLLGWLTGKPVARGEVIDARASPVDPSLVNLVAKLPDVARYTTVRDGNAQASSHVLVNGALLKSDPRLRLEVARINADFGIDHAADTGVPMRVAERDPLVLYLEF